MGGRAIIIVVLLGSGWVLVTALEPAAPPETSAAGIAEIERVGEHFRLANPARLDDREAEAIYQATRAAMQAGFALSGDPVASAYQLWQRFNRAPYRSATHGERLVNNYANDAARGYGSVTPLPVGSILAKDAVTVTADGAIHPGSLALMEKMPPGFDAEGHDWRYTLIMPDGDVLGTTAGAGAAQVDFCRECHAAAGAAADFLFLVPSAYRREAARPASTAPRQ